MREIGIKEFKILKNITHPNIIKMYEAYSNEAKETVYLIMELLQGDTLSNYVKKDERLHPHTAKEILRQLLHALVYIHSHSIVHRYIKNLHNLK